MDRQQLLVEEYKIAQTTINHYERLIWTIGSILNASVMVMAGLAIKENKGDGFWVVVLISIILSSVWFSFECRYRDVNKQKFRRLWELEDELGFKQNRYVKEADDEKLTITAHHLISALCIGLPTLLFIYWIQLLFK